MNLLKAIWRGFERALNVYLVTQGEGIRVNLGWSRPVTKASGHVSGDALAHWRFEGMPLPNIWEGK